MPKGMPNLENTVFLPSGGARGDRSFLPPAEVTRTGNRVFDETVMKFDNNQSKFYSISFFNHYHSVIK